MQPRASAQAHQNNLILFVSSNLVRAIKQLTFDGWLCVEYVQQTNNPFAVWVKWSTINWYRVTEIQPPSWMCAGNALWYASVQGFSCVWGDNEFEYGIRTSSSRSKWKLKLFYTMSARTRSKYKPNADQQKLTVQLKNIVIISGNGQWSYCTPYLRMCARGE